MQLCAGSVWGCGGGRCSRGASSAQGLPLLMSSPTPTPGVCRADPCSALGFWFPLQHIVTLCFPHPSSVMITSLVFFIKTHCWRKSDPYVLFVHLFTYFLQGLMSSMNARISPLVCSMSMDHSKAPGS